MAGADEARKTDGTLVSGLRRFLSEFAQFAGRGGAVTALFVLIGALVEGLGLVLIVPLLGIVVGSTTASGRLEHAAITLFRQIGVERPFAQLALMMGVFGALMVIRAVTILVRDVRVAQLQAGFIEAQRLRLVQRLVGAPWQTIARLRHARITHLMGGDVQRIAAMAQQSLQCVIAVAMLAVQCALVFVLAPSMALLAAVPLAVAFFLFAPSIRQAHGQGGRTTRTNLALLDLTGQFLGGLKLAVSQNLQPGFVAEFRHTLREVTRLQVATVRHLSRRRLVLSIVSATLVSVLVLIGFGVFEMSPPRLIALLLIAIRMFGPIGQIQSGLQQIALALPVYETVKTLESELGTVAEPLAAAAKPVAVVEGAIVLAAVSFIHPSEDDAPGPARGVKNLDLTIAPGEWLGIVGPSGAGKTTFADLLVGLLQPQSGRIAVGGMPLQGAALAAWRDGVAYVAQDPFLFHDTVRRNLVWAHPQAGEADLWDALRVAGADDVVRRLPQGLDAVVGERGTLLSGGERQRLALARAVVRRPRLLVLDEATSAIDVAGEREILGRLRMLALRPTVVIIAHRADSVALCDRVLRFADGAST